MVLPGVCVRCGRRVRRSPPASAISEAPAPSIPCHENETRQHGPPGHRHRPGTFLGCQQLHAQAADDHGNTSGTATVLTLNAAGGASRTGGIQVAGDLDWFRVVIPSQSTGIFTLTGAPGQTVQIYKAATPTVVWKGGSIPAGGTRVALANILPTGTYFARVAGATGSYTLAIASRVSGDINADRKADVLWQHSTTGQMSVWYMNGRTKLGEAVFPTQPAAGWKLVNSGDFNTD